MIKISRIIMISEKSAPFFINAMLQRGTPQRAYKYIIMVAKKNYNEKFGKKTKILRIFSGTKQ